MKDQLAQDPVTGANDLPWSNGNPAQDVLGSIVPYQAFVYPGTEICNLIRGAGITPSDADLSQALEAVRALIAAAISGIPPVQFPPAPVIPTYTGNTGVAINGTVAQMDINSLTQVGNATPADLIPLLQNGADHKISVNDLATEILSLAHSTQSLSVRVPNLITFPTSGTYTPSSGVRQIIVRGCGGGGAGATATPNGAQNGYVGNGGGGGGGGAFVTSISLNGSTTPISVTIGSGGVSGAPNTGAVGGAGGSTSFGSYASATGGQGGLPASANYGNAASLGIGGQGGTAYLISGSDGYTTQGGAGAVGGTQDGAQGGSSIFGGGGYAGSDCNNGQLVSPSGGGGGLGAGGGGCDYHGSNYGTAGSGGNGFIEIIEYF